MIDSIYVGMSGLAGFSSGLRAIANNTTNLNTPGYKSTSMQFSDAFYSRSSSNGGNSGQLGYGLSTAGTALSFKQGEMRQTGNGLDLAIDGEGLFTLKNPDGSTAYSRAGQFHFNADGVLVNAAGAKVLGLDANGVMSEISIAGMKTQPGKASSVLSFNGNVSPASATQNIAGVKVIDAAGGEHTLSVKLTDTSATTAGSWRVDLLEGSSVVGTGQLVFDNTGRPTAASAKVSMSYTPAGQATVPLTLDFSTDVTSNSSKSVSAINFSKQDGYASADLTSTAFDATGVLILTYANGETAKGSRLSLSRFDSTATVRAIGDNEYEATDSSGWHAGTAGGAFGSVKSGFVELSNVDLSQEFSDLVIMQRGYQASSQVITTANEMLQQLFSMQSK
ncbi:flagellar hook protein FlgE [Xylophilus sp. ASV27]|uniref:flagellar hook protein FlgE n=1 Tax=Xylophilus sp. ASV27 TaxID=2795129 RepID=UPI0018EB7B8C|nr:flagellar hook-basal body complex protein [Xylophilus sp. ASV27]